jgi:uncharacterized protein
VCLTSLLYAEPIKQLKPTGYVDDFAGVLDNSSSTAIRNLCEQVDLKAKAQIAVVTVNSLDGSDVESYAVNLYKQWGIGSKSSNRGVLILIAVNDRHYRIEVGYGLEPILPDGKVGGFGREAAPLLQQKQYGPALLLMAQRVAEVIAADAGATLNIPVTPAQATPDITLPLLRGGDYPDRDRRPVRRGPGSQNVRVWRNAQFPVLDLEHNFAFYR